MPPIVAYLIILTSPLWWSLVYAAGLIISAVAIGFYFIMAPLIGLGMRTDLSLFRGIILRKFDGLLPYLLHLILGIVFLIGLADLSLLSPWIPFWLLPVLYIAIQWLLGNAERKKATA